MKDNNRIKINFLLPYRAKRPTGGIRMMYEYANRLARKGYDIHLYYPLKTRFIPYRFPFPIRWMLSKIEGFRTFRWFKFDPRIAMSQINSISDKSVRDADVVIATWWSTASDMGMLSPSKGKKINLIQGFENWNGHEDLLLNSYRMKDVTNIVIASFLKEIVDKYSVKESIIIENAIDTDVFRVTVPVEERNPYSVCMNYSTLDIKGSDFGIEALMKVKAVYPQLAVDIFSIFPRPESLPDWVAYHRTPQDLAAVYNNNAIFISNSFTEGFGLVSVEAMACGCALICTDIPGHREFAFDNDTSLLVEPRDSEQMAEKILYLIKDNERRISFAKRGNEYVKKYSWEVAINKMEAVIKSLI
ncbi:glycosyltransferase family 4 protein [Dysgonomonas sp. 520]|uniref:glycosyltransferase family 4 protein n=1 Tax=Dysgonomonas sp. 520 TaxID=2302931 RepID=UPI0013D0B106|nr:glycosyltransferase family 4 protein [Dysgonomonas sp. 520]NDW09985.1 glycosyltransferase [Dysgonomonas sp. 520]